MLSPSCGELAVNPEIRSADDLRGIDCDWLARDADDHVGMFSTAGGGYTPEGFVRNIHAHVAAIDAILALPPSTSARFAPELPAEYTNHWRLVAERGFFAFDSDFRGADFPGGPYCLVAAPETPVVAAELPTIVVEALSSMQCRRLSFATLTAISADLLQHQ
jgi:hypothetical protein